MTEKQIEKILNNDVNLEWLGNVYFYNIMEDNFYIFQCVNDDSYIKLKHEDLINSRLHKYQLSIINK